jgi:hypothetical protein
MVEKGAFSFALETQAAGWQVRVALPPQAAASLTGGQEACQICFGDGRVVEVHVVIPTDQVRFTGYSARV